jgi:hypothetical protein
MQVNEACADDCSEFADKSISISIGFRYKDNRDLELPQSGRDSSFYYQQAANYTDNRMQLLDEDATSKSTFLKKLTEETKSATYVNINYSGHGTVSNGKWEMILPNAPERYLHLHCFDFMMNEKFCAGVQNYIVTDSELRNALGPNKKIFGIIDSCHSGSIDLGPNSTVLAASARDQGAYSQPDSNHGALTGTLIKLSNQCNLDKNKDGKISATELLSQFSQMPPDSTHQSRSSSFQDVQNLRQGKILSLPQQFSDGRTTAEETSFGANLTGEQRPGIIGNAKAPWLNCLNFSRPVNSSCGKTQNADGSNANGTGIHSVD